MEFRLFLDISRNVEEEQRERQKPSKWLEKTQTALQAYKRSYLQRYQWDEIISALQILHVNVILNSFRGKSRVYCQPDKPLFQAINEQVFIEGPVWA